MDSCPRVISRALVLTILSLSIQKTNITVTDASILSKLFYKFYLVHCLIHLWTSLGQDSPIPGLQTGTGPQTVRNGPCK